MNIDTRYNSLNFKTSYKKVLTPNFVLGETYECSTYFFVKDFQWNKFFNYIIDKFKSTPKVNIFSLACSDGSEAYSIAMLLLSKLGNNAQKFFPITAVDFDKDITQNAKNCFMDLSAEDEVRINKYTGNKLNKFFSKTDKTFLSDKMGGTNKQVLLTRFRTKPILRDKVLFVTEDINTYVDKLPNNNNLIFCRNCWPYLWKTSEKFARKVSDKMDMSSYLITGNYDTLMCPINGTASYGLSLSKEFQNVYDKSGNNYFDDMRLFFSEIKDDI